MSAEIDIQVESDAGDPADRRPLRFSLGKRQIDVEENIDKWHGQDYSYYKLKGSDGGIYILRRDETTQHWELTLYDAGHRDETRLSST